MIANNRNDANKKNSQDLISNQISYIFGQDIKVSFNKTSRKFIKRFYAELNPDLSLKLLIPLNGHADLFNFLSPTRDISKLFLRFLKLLYCTKMLRFIPNFKIIEIEGFEKINWNKYCWNDSSPPNTLTIIGTHKKSQNAVVFLHSLISNQQTLVIKKSLTKYSNLSNEFSSANFIQANKTKYLTFNENEGYIVQQYQKGFRKVCQLTDCHIHYLSKMIIANSKISSKDLKHDLNKSLIKFQHSNKSTFNIIKSKIASISNNANLRLASVHGDFAPYNIIYQKFPDNFALIDWEVSSNKGVALVDLFNYVYITDCLFGKMGFKKLDKFLYSKALLYFKHIDYDLSLELFNQYKIYFIINEFLIRLDEAGDKDIYVKYLLNIIKNEI
jgi:hypothetical protein